MKKGLSLFLASVLLLASFTGCKKEKANPGIRPNDKSISKEEDLDNASYPGNPYDSIGYYHNLILQETRTVWSDKVNNTAEDFFNAASTYCYNHGIPLNATFQDAFALTSAIAADSPNHQSVFATTLGMSQQAVTYTQAIFEIANNSFSYDTYQEYKDDIITQENSILSDNSLSADDRADLLKAASVARHSALYWARELAGYNSDPNIDCDPNEAPKSIWGWIKNAIDAVHKWTQKHPVLTADIGGALGGGALSGWIGSALGAAGASLVAWSQTP